MTSAQKRRLSDSLEAYAYLAPAGIILLIFWFLPVLVSFAMSFGNLTALAPLGEAQFVGAAQYARAIGSEGFQQSLWNTINYAIYHVPLTLVLSLAAAVLLNTKIRGRGFWRTAYFLPYVTTWVAISIVWLYIFHREFGLANWLLRVLSVDIFGMESPWRLEWLEEGRGIWELAFGFNAPALPFGFQALIEGPSLAMFAIVITSVWRDIGYFMVIFLAGLQNIDKSYYEAAAIDGANGWQRFLHITFPLLSPVSFFLLVISLIQAFQVFVPMLIMTPNGGPGGTTTTIVFYLFEQGFRGSWQLSYAAAVAYILTGMILILTIVQNKFLGSRVEYQQ